MSPEAVIDFSAHRFQPAKTLEQILEHHADYWRSWDRVRGDLVRHEFVCTGRAAFWRAKCCGERRLVYLWYDWQRYETGEIRRVFRDELRICATCGEVPDQHAYHPREDN